MKQIFKTILIATLFIGSSTVLFAQAESGNYYLQMIGQRLSEGDCESAQRNYNMWKKLTEKTDADIEAEIEFCQKANTNIKTNKNTSDSLYIGMDYQGGRIAYLDGSKKHGLIITIHNVTNEEVTWAAANDTCKALKIGGYIDWRLPSKEELLEICKKKSLFGLFSYYWTSNYYSSSSAAYVGFSNCTSGNESPSTKNQVRAVRNF